MPDKKHKKGYKMLEIKNMKVEVDTRILLDHFNLSLNKGDKLAIIGEEGNGKSTLLKCIIGNCPYAKVTGDINTKGNRLGYLKQQLTEEELNCSVEQYLFASKEAYFNHMTQLYQSMKKLHLSDALLEQEKMKYLSGGEKVKLQLLKLLLEEPDILLLDEPTNDLDIETLEWLEHFINRESKPIIYVSHDEMLLSRTANMILHLELIKKKQVAKHTLLKIGYDEYVHTRLRSLEKIEQVARKERQEKLKQEEKLRKIYDKVAYEQEHISRQNPHGAKMLKRKMKTVKAQEKRMERVELTEMPDPEEAIYFCFEQDEIPKSKQVLDLKVMELKAGNRVLVHDIYLTVHGGEHIVIIGKNGVGKTTLLKLIYDRLQKRSDIKLGYMPQEYHSILNQYKNPVDFLVETGSMEEVSLVRSYLGNMKFTANEMTGDIHKLSGGSKAKLLLIKLVLQKCNVLILDEPTRNVSPLSNPVIRKVLKEYKGVIISISHDRKYIEEVCDKVYELKENGLIEQKKDSFRK